MGLIHSPRIAIDDLALCLDAANKRSYGGSGTTWTDLKGSNDGTLTNGPTFDTGNRGGIILDGTNDKISISNTDIFSLVANQDFSICIIAKDIGGWLFYIDLGSNLGAQMGCNNNEFYWSGAGRGAAYAEAEHNTTFSAGTWYHIVCTKDTSGNPTVYIDGVFKGTTNPASANSINSSIDFSSASEFQLGYSTSYSSYSSATFAHFSYYNRELTPDEVMQNYLATKGRYE
tara:strand:+ start:215 stop:904 length:690 start_codon:yes stop_codon:yes gene_type:complete